MRKKRGSKKNLANSSKLSLGKFGQPCATNFGNTGNGIPENES